jgi:hypothetical protein
MAISPKLERWGKTTVACHSTGGECGKRFARPKREQGQQQYGMCNATSAWFLQHVGKLIDKLVDDDDDSFLFSLGTCVYCIFVLIYVKFSIRREYQKRSMLF